MALEVEVLEVVEVAEVLEVVEVAVQFQGQSVLQATLKKGIK